MIVPVHRCVLEGKDLNNKSVRTTTCRISTFMIWTALLTMVSPNAYARQTEGPTTNILGNSRTWEAMAIIPYMLTNPSSRSRSTRTLRVRSSALPKASRSEATCCSLGAGCCERANRGESNYQSRVTSISLLCTVWSPTGKFLLQPRPLQNSQNKNPVDQCCRISRLPASLGEQTGSTDPWESLQHFQAKIPGCMQILATGSVNQSLPCFGQDV